MKKGKRSAVTAKKETTSVIWLGPREIWCGSLLEIRGNGNTPPG